MMLLKNALCLFLVLICINGKVAAQETLFFKDSQINRLKVDEENIAIFKRPVTNREYIIYLQWMRSVFFANYPDMYLKSIPGLDLDTLKKVGGQPGVNIMDINTIINCSKPFVKDYMFNPKYLDYPVIGVSWQNANNYGLWLADRYNEYTLIRMGYLNFTYSPTENDFFSTDMYLAGRWQGQVRRYLKSGDPANPERTFNWSDNIFIPVFRLPSGEEKKAAGDICADNNCFKVYPFTKRNFLVKWEQMYLASESDSVLNLRTSDYLTERIVSRKSAKVKITGELTLDINKETNETKLPEIYKQNGQELKSLENYTVKECCAEGLNSNPVICEDKNGKPILVTPYNDKQPPNYNEFYIFRLACSLNEIQVSKLKK